MAQTSSLGRPGGLFQFSAGAAI